MDLSNLTASNASSDEGFSKRSVAVSAFAAAAALAAGSESYGAVIPISPIPANIPGTTTAAVAATFRDIDLNGDGNSDVEFFYTATAGTAASNWASGIYGAGGGVVGYIGPFSIAYATRLTTGTTVGPSSAFVQTTGYLSTLASSYSGTQYGGFKNNVRGFAGFKFAAADGTHYGYMELQTSRATGLNFFSGAWESTPGTAITIAVPEPTSLAGLAFGAAALLNRRRTKAN
jgi:hypothetical protein